MCLSSLVTGMSEKFYFIRELVMEHQTFRRAASHSVHAKSSPCAESLHSNDNLVPVGAKPWSRIH